MGEYISYHRQEDLNYIKKTRKLLQILPPYCTDFFRGTERQTATKTQYAYANDLLTFFTFLVEKNPLLSTTNIRDIPLDLLDQLKIDDIDEYIQYLKLYKSSNGKERTNQNSGIDRKISALKSFYNWLNLTEKILHNPAGKLLLSKKSDKEIIRLEPDEIANLLDIVEFGTYIKSSREEKAHERNKTRDLALLTLLLGTGIRVSECVGIDITDIDYNTCGVLIHRKGGNEVTIYFGEEVEKALTSYMEERKHINTITGHENAFFLSSHRKRISVSSVENIVKKYATLVSPLKKITPHKLRSTYGTSLYRETGDIYLVADVLGHNDVNTTKRHYAAIEENRRRQARNVVKLRESKD